MSDNPDLLPNPTHEDPFEVQMRGYARRQVDEFVARSRNHARDLEERLSRSLDEVERLRLELSTARQAASGKPAHEEVSERISQILKLADDEANAQKTRADDDIAKLRGDAQKAAEATRAEAKGQADRMLAAAQEQAERAIAAARAEAEKTRNSANAEAERTATNSRKNAESAIATAKAQAKQMLDEATARATAIHDGAERRLDLLKNRHTEAMRRLTEIRDVVTDLVSHDAAKGTLDEEVDKAVAATLGGPPSTSQGKTGSTAAQAKAKPVSHASPAQPAAAASPAAASSGAATSSPQSVRPSAEPARPAQPGPGGAQHARHAATSSSAMDDRPLRQPKPTQASRGEPTGNGSVPEASPDDVRVIMP